MTTLICMYPEKGTELFLSPALEYIRMFINSEAVSFVYQLKFCEEVPHFVSGQSFKQRSCLKALSGDNSKRVPPDPISNSEVKTLCADDSMGSPHVKVGHCQAIKYKKARLERAFLHLPGW